MKVQFKMTGETPILFHADDVEASDELMEWRKAPENKNVSVPGDDRSPAWTWQSYLYSDGASLVWPSQNVMVGLRAAGAQMILKKQKTFKEITQSGMLVDTEYCKFLCNGRELPIGDIHKLRDKPFKKQAEEVQGMGFKLFVKRARVGTAKHVRVRARFETWSVEGTITVFVPEITIEVLTKLFELGGRGGQGDWRPNCKTPGPYGMYTTELKKLK